MERTGKTSALSKAAQGKESEKDEPVSGPEDTMRKLHGTRATATTDWTGATELRKITTATDMGKERLRKETKAKERMEQSFPMEKRQERQKHKSSFEASSTTEPQGLKSN